MEMQELVDKVNGEWEEIFIQEDLCACNFRSFSDLLY